MDRPDEPTVASSGWGLGKLGGFFKRLTGEAPITEEELSPVMDSLKKKVRVRRPLNGSWWRRTWRRRSQRPSAAT